MWPYSLIALLRLIIGVGSLLAGIQCISGFSENWLFTLRIAGGLVLFHLIFEASIVLVGRAKIFAGQEETLDKFTIDTNRQVVNWLIAGSGVIIGLLARTQSLTQLAVASALSLGICIVLGFIHISVLAGGVHSEASNQVTLGAVNAFYANLLLNLMFIFFLFGIVGLAVGLITISQP